MILVVTGPPGSGKTYFSISKAEQLSKMMGVPFGGDNIALKAEEFIDAIDSPTLLSPPGSNLVFDEVGVTLSSRTWQNRLQVFLNFYLQTCRSRNNVIWMTTPSFGFVDAQARSLTNAIIEMKGIDHHHHLSRAKPLLVQTNQRSGKSYFKYLQYSNTGIGTCKFVETVAHLPSKPILEVYEQKKANLVRGIVTSMKDTLAKERAKLEPKAQTVPNLVEGVAMTVREREVYEDWVNGVSVAESAARLKCSAKNIYSFRHIVQRRIEKPAQEALVMA